MAWSSGKLSSLKIVKKNGISEEESWKQMTLMWTRMKESVGGI